MGKHSASSLSAISNKTLSYRTVLKLTTDFKGKGGNFCSKTIKYCFDPKLKAIAEVRSYDHRRLADG
ncbi:hypothetical protein CYANOKiyG1_06260 [Okeania sp. KiyG1]|nr:hypothetical protein CYANOKiyG1_06260 [Okeania sp. KiyG1]